MSLLNEEKGVEYFTYSHFLFVFLLYMKRRVLNNSLTVTYCCHRFHPPEPFYAVEEKKGESEEFDSYRLTLSSLVRNIPFPGLQGDPLVVE